MERNASAVSEVWLHEGGDDIPAKLGGDRHTRAPGRSAPRRAEAAAHLAPADEVQISREPTRNDKQAFAKPVMSDKDALPYADNLLYNPSAQCLGGTVPTGLMEDMRTGVLR